MHIHIHTYIHIHTHAYTYTYIPSEAYRLGSHVYTLHRPSLLPHTNEFPSSKSLNLFTCQTDSHGNVIVCTQSKLLVLELCMYECMNECMHVYIYMCVCVCMYVCMYLCMYVYVCVCMYVYVYVCMYMYMYVNPNDICIWTCSADQSIKV